MPGLYPAFTPSLCAAANYGGAVTATQTITIIDTPIAGLVATSDSPTLLSSPTTLTAAITAGTNVTFAWRFGDGGEDGLGAVVTHTYALPGVYTATVTAANSASEASAVTVVVVVRPVLQRYYLPWMQKPLSSPEGSGGEELFRIGMFGGINVLLANAAYNVYTTIVFSTTARR